MYRVSILAFNITTTNKLIYLPIEYIIRALAYLVIIDYIIEALAYLVIIYYILGALAYLVIKG